MLVGGEGIGYRIRMESRVLNMSIVYIYLGILGFTGLLADWSLLKLRRYLCPWYQR
jgi:ABC-type nitrate/sulfonate/bicarbonate transport system permease component